MLTESQTPLPLIRQWAEIIPHVWEDFAALTERNRQSADRRVADEAELFAALSIIQRWTPPDATSPAETAHAAFDLCCCALWRQHKVVYAFDPALSDELIRQADDWTDASALPIEVLLHPPYRCCFISAPGAVGARFVGFFPSIVRDIAGDGAVLALTAIYSEEGGPGAHTELLHLSGDTVGACVEDTMRAARRAAAKADSVAHIDRPTILRLLNLYLYICADNAEVDRTPAPTYRPRQPGAPIRDKFREVQPMPTGLVIGAALRRSASSRASSGSRGKEDGQRRHTRAHTRRGHWHHFWVGPKSAPESRRIILKWVHPVLVGGKAEPEITTIHPVK